MSTATYLGQSLSARVGEFIALRRDIHANPELGFEEHRTAALVADKLRQWGYEVHTGIGGTGVVGRLQRGKAHAAWGCVPTWMPCRSRRRVRAIGAAPALA